MSQSQTFSSSPVKASSVIGTPVGHHQHECGLDVAKEGLKQALGFDADHWPATTDELWDRDLDSDDDRAPYRE